MVIFHSFPIKNGDVPIKNGDFPYVSVLIYTVQLLVGGWANPSEKYDESSVGMMTFPIYGKINNVPNYQPDIHIYNYMYICMYTNINYFNIYYYINLYEFDFKKIQLISTNPWLNRGINTY